MGRAGTAERAGRAERAGEPRGAGRAGSELGELGNVRPAEARALFLHGAEARVPKIYSIAPLVGRMSLGAFLTFATMEMSTAPRQDIDL